MAGEALRLSEHEAFSDLVIATAADTGIPEPMVEKDFWITEVLRAAVATLGPAVKFKGGTSLSKGWHLIKRFSEDVDLLVDPSAVDPAWDSRGKVDRGLKRLVTAVGAIPGLRLETPPINRSSGSSRADRLTYEARFAGIPGLEASILLEPGVGGGYSPATDLSIQSQMAEYMVGHGIKLVDIEGLELFSMQVIERRRTFVEKLFTLESAVRQHVEGQAIGRDVRHYADLYALVDLPDVRAMLEGPEYGMLVVDVDAQGERFYPAHHQCPPGMRFKDSLLFPPPEVVEAIRRAYETECRRLFYGAAHPAFAQVLSALEAVRPLL